MAVERSGRRLPLRDLLTDAQKRTRDLLDKVGVTWINRITDLRELSRPHRKRSPYPTLIALHNVIHEMLQLHEETAESLDTLIHELDEIRDHALRERMGRR